MRAGTGSRALIAFLSWLLFAVPGLGLASAPERDETERWVPSISMHAGIIGQKASGTVESSDVLGPAAPPVIQPIRPAVAGSSTLLSAVVGGGIELMTPRLVETAGRPRFFAHVDLSGAFGFERTVAGESKPGEFVPPFTSLPGSFISEGTIAGQGSRTLAETQSFLVSAGAGVAFTVDWGYRRIRIKPSVEYLREEIQITGRVHRVVTTSLPSTTYPDDFRFIQLTDSRTVTYHGLGPGVEFEADTARAGPFMMSLFASGQGYYYFGERDVALYDENEFGENATWKFDKQAWGWGARLGLRFRWVPE